LTVLAFTRPKRRLDASIALAEAAGFTVMAAPSLEIVRRSAEDFNALFRSVRKDDVVIFTSPTSAEECARCAFLRDSLKGTLIVSIGPGTSAALEDIGIRADTMPPEYSSEGLAKHLSASVAGKRVIILRSDRGSDVLERSLTAAGADVTNFASYMLTISDPGHLSEMIDAGMNGKIDVFAFTSPLSARSFAEAAVKRTGSKDMFDNALTAAIGRPTADALISVGIKADIMPERATFEEMIYAIKKRTERTIRRDRGGVLRLIR